MRLRAFLRHGLIVVYLLVALSGLLFAVFRLRLPVVPPALRSYAYQMMAPFQGYVTYHQDFYARGERPDGTSVAIDLAPYFPYSRSERFVRSHLPSLVMVGRTDSGAVIRSFAQQILAAERRGGRDFRSIEFGAERWPATPQGYDAQRWPPSIEIVSSVTVP